MASVLKSIFGGGGSAPSFNPTPLRNILTAGADTQRGIVNALPDKLAPVSNQFQTTSNQLGTGFTQGTAGRVDSFQKNYVNPEASAALVGAKQEQNFRGVPAAQQAIREALASTGRLQTGRAANALTAPVLAAAEDTRDFASDVALNDEAARRDALKTGLTTNQSAELSKLGLDSDTMKALFESGRGDIIQQAADLLGIEGDLTQGLFNLENTTQQSNISSALNESNNRQSLRNALLGIGGNLAGVGIGKLIPQRLGTTSPTNVAV